MADDTTRIINLTEATEISDGMYLVTDASTGTRKLSLQKVLDKAGGNVADEYDSTATYDVGDLCVYKGVLYECTTAITTAEAWNSAHWSRINLGDIVADIDGSIEELYEDKANESGEYDDIVAGTAKQLLSSIFTANDSPYLYRPTPADSDRERVKRLEGLSLGWNQLVQNGNFADASNWVPNNSTVSASGNVGTIEQTDADGYINQAISVVQWHKYLVLADINGNSGCNYAFNSLIPTSAYTGSGWQTFANIYTHNSATAYFVIRQQNGDFPATWQIRNVQIIDLTALFGTTIADHIYTLEQATAGSGVAWVKQYIDLDSYHAYSVPTIKSVEGLTSHDMVGFNQWDEEYLQGYYSGTGTYTQADNQLCTKNMFKVVNGAEYWIQIPNYGGASFEFAVVEYDADKNFIQRVSKTSVKTAEKYGASYTPSASCRYINLNLSAGYGTTYNHDICINLSDPSRNGTYEPYEKHSYPLDSAITLRGIPKLVDGKLVADGDYYPPSGDMTVRYGIVDLGTLNWTYTSDWGGAGAFYTGGIANLIKKATDSGIPVNCICPIYVNKSRNELYSDVSNGLAVNTIGDVSIRDSAYTDATAFKTAMSGVYLVYELATPTTSTASPYQEVQICESGGTEEFVTDGVVPVGNVTEYTADLRRQVENIYGIPPVPEEDGEYTLHATVADGVKTFTWESEA